MGLLKAGVGALGGVLADAWREYFYCESIDADVLVCKGAKRTSNRSSNTKGTDNIISNGSIIAVADGQAMAIIEQGKVVEFCAEPGEFVFDNSTEPTIMYGGLSKENISNTLKTVGKRFTFGGQAPKDQRVYYFNTKEIPGNKYGTPNPIPFRVVDTNIGLDIDIGIRCNGEYSYKIVDPIAFYANVSGNVSDEYKRSQIDSQLKAELLTNLQPAFARISELGLRYSALPAHTTEIADALNDILSKSWTEKRGIKIFSFGVNSVSANPEDEERIKMMQQAKVLSNPNMGAGFMTGYSGPAMKDAANNTAGAMTGFMGMGFAQGMGGNAAANMYQAGAQQPMNNQPQYGQGQGYQPPQQYGAVGGFTQPQAGAWTCECGASNTGKFCTQCGKPKPAAGGSWTCVCGAVNTGKFCTNCGKPAPSAAPKYRCSKCGWMPEDQTNPPKFCPQCGDPINGADIVG